MLEVADISNQENKDELDSHLAGIMQSIIVQATVLNVLI